MTTIRLATPDEAPLLGPLAKASKGYWDYASEQLSMWESLAMFTIPPADCAAGLVGVADDDAQLRGFYRLGLPKGTDNRGTLEDLWVHPDAIGTGLGRLLLLSASADAESRRLAELRLYAEPKAVGFYQHMGVVLTGNSVPAPLPGQFSRTLPEMSLVI